jgi:hypothetical protein
MAKMRLPLAICLALVVALVLGPSPVGWADGPGGYGVNTGPTDGGDGHPWDDGTIEQTTPGEDVTEPLEIEPTLPGSRPIVGVDKGFLGLTQKALISLWYKVRAVEISQRTAMKAEVKHIPTKSRPVR